MLPRWSGTLLAMAVMLSSVANAVNFEADVECVVIYDRINAIIDGFDREELTNCPDGPSEDLFAKLPGMANLQKTLVGTLLERCQKGEFEMVPPTYKHCSKIINELGQCRVLHSSCGAGKVFSC